MLPPVNTIHTAQGEYLLFATADLISTVLYRQGQWEKHLVDISRYFFHGVKAPLVLDIGANLGAYAVPVAREIAAAGGEVVCFEPQRIVHYQLCGNIVLNRLDNVTVHHCALGPVNGTVEIPEMRFDRSENVGGFSLLPEFRRRQGLDGAMHEGPTRAVPMQRLDDLALPRSPCLIKIDVEGYELSVLQGGAEFLARHGHPPILFEAWGEDWFDEGRAALFGWLQAQGYRISRLIKDDYMAQHPAHARQVRFEPQADGTLVVGQLS